MSSRRKINSKNLIKLDHDLKKSKIRMKQFNKAVEKGELKWLYYSMGETYFEKQ